MAHESNGHLPLRCRLLGVGAMNSPRYAPAGLLVEHGSTRIAFDGGGGATPSQPVIAWLVTDTRGELIRELRTLARSQGVEPRAESWRGPGLTVERLAVVHTNHPAFGYRIIVDQGSVVWAPEFLEFPSWAAGVDLAFMEAAAWDRTIWFRGKVGGHMAATEVAREARRLGVRRLVFAHIGRPTIRAIDRGDRTSFDEFGNDGDLFVVDRSGSVRRFGGHVPTDGAD